MPSVPDEFIPLGARSPLPDGPQAADPGLLDAAGAAATLFNWPVRSWRYLSARAGSAYDPVHNPFDVIAGTKYATDPGRFAGSRDMQETQAIMREMDRDQEAASIYAKSGTAGTVAMIGAGLLDPTIFLPVLKFFTGAKAGYTAFRLAGDTALAGAMGASIAEGAMAVTTPDYTAKDFAVGVGTATVLSGLLGAGAGALMSRSERKALEAKLLADREAWGADIAPGLPQSAGAAAADTRALELTKTPFDSAPGGDPTRGLSPTRRVLRSSLTSARRAVADLAETPYTFADNAEGIATTSGPALDRLAKLEIGRARVGLAETLETTFTRYRFAEQDANALQRGLSGLGDAMGRPRTKMSFPEFKSAIDEALRNGDAHAVPEIAEAAQYVRRTIIQPWTDRAIKAGLLPEGVEPKTAATYMTRVWDKQKLIARRPEVVERFSSWLSREQARKVEIKGRLQDLGRQLDDAEQLLAKTTDDAGKVAAEAEVGRLRGRIEEELRAWKGKSAAEAVSALARREKAALGRVDDAPHLRQADNAVTRAMERILASDPDMSAIEIEARANEIVDRILGTPDGRLPYDAASAPGDGFANSVNPDPRGPLAPREFMIPDAEIRDLLETDLQATLSRFMHTIVPDVLLTEKFGDVRMTQTMKRIAEESAARAKAATSEKARTKIHAERDAVMADLVAIRDRIRGTYGWSSDPRMRAAGRTAATVGKLNMMADLGGVAISSLPDLAGPIFHYGLTSTFRHAWKPMLGMLTDPATRKAALKAKDQMRVLGIAAETYLQSRVGALNDMTEIYRPASRFERVVDYASDKFFLGNLLSPWTDFAKWGAGMVSVAETSKAAEAVAKGAGTKRQVGRLAEAGIDGAMAQRIAKQLQAEGGSDLVNGVRLANTDVWTDRGAREAFEGALARDVDMMVITPGQERALIMSRNPAVALILQYKTFVQAATERLLVRGMQVRDAQALQGFVAAVVLGMIGEYAYSAATGREKPKDAAEWVKAGISRSGMTGWLEEANAVTSKWTGGTLDAYRLIGAEQPASRYLSRSNLGVLLGPTANKLDGLISAGGSAIDGSWTAADTRRIRRLAAGQNIFYLRRLLDQGEAEANAMMGIPAGGR